ncbi:MAG: secondary thiamine-phosphate synthase enzyme YjbQ [Thermodesulfobacteriota bacterium]|nr:secondary thiamine-phosphate synthase enzyme YjbQ [Thermodesulfobacteriota bacterium]
MIKRLEVKTTLRVQLVDITSQIKDLVREENMVAGFVIIYVPHTTCGITINENADPNLKDDIINTLAKLVPDSRGYTHIEGNADAHIKTCLIGSSVEVLVESATLVLGTWQGIFLAEFDGPRKRSVLIKMVPC